MLMIILPTTKTNISRSSGDWNIISSDPISYNLDQSYWMVEVDGNTLTASGGFFKEIMIEEQGTFTIEVIDIDEEWGLEYQFANVTNSINEYITMDRFYFEFLRFLYYPLDECKNLQEIGFNETRILKGPSIIPWFFIEPTEETWDFLLNMSDINYHNSLPIVKNIKGSMRAFFDIVNTEVNFDILIQGIIQNETEMIDIEFDHNLKFVWDETTGILLGYRISSYFAGKYKGHSITEQIDVVCMQFDYKLERFSFLVGFIPGFTFFITLMSIGSLGIIILIIKKIKLKNKQFD